MRRVEAPTNPVRSWGETPQIGVHCMPPCCHLGDFKGWQGNPRQVPAPIGCDAVLQEGNLLVVRWRPRFIPGPRPRYFIKGSASMTKRKPVAPRNPLVAVAKFKQAGVHGKSVKASRRQEKMSLQWAANSVGQSTRLLIGESHGSNPAPLTSSSF